VFVSHFGAHQFAFPSNLIVDGTTIARTIVASTITATINAKPMDLMINTSARTKPKNTATMIAAAPVIRLPEAYNPSATAFVLSPVFSHASWIRDSIKTS